MGVFYYFDNTDFKCACKIPYNTAMLCVWLSTECYVLFEYKWWISRNSRYRNDYTERNLKEIMSFIIF